MTFFESITTVFRKYAEFGGRAGRSVFWWFILFSALVSAALNSLSLSLSGPMSGRMFEFGVTASSAYGYVSFASVWSVVALLPTLAVAVRRLRDAGREWTELFWLLLPIIGWIILIVHLCDRSTTVVADTTGATAQPTGA
jgi:uncharacterized membrane protein YhaH (DUF805 family)